MPKLKFGPEAVVSSASHLLLQTLSRIAHASLTKPPTRRLETRKPVNPHMIRLIPESIECVAATAAIMTTHDSTSRIASTLSSSWRMPKIHFIGFTVERWVT